MEKNRDDYFIIYTHVALWGAVGAAARYYISTLFNHMGNFPIGTFLANSVGCFLLASIYNYLGKMWHHEHRIVVGLGTGFIGAFTTFATFSTEVIKYAISGKVIKALVYWMGGAVCGILSAFLALYLTDKLFEKYGGED